MSFETIRIHNDYPIIDNRVRIGDAELSELEALIAYDGSEIIELFNGGHDKQEIFRLAPIIPGNPGPSEWFVLVSDSIGVRTICYTSLMVINSNSIIITADNSTGFWECPSSYLSDTFSIEGWGGGATGTSVGGGGGAYSKLNAGSFDPTPNEVYNYELNGPHVDFRDSPNDNSQVLLAKSGSSINGGLASECIGDVKYSGGNGGSGGGGSSAGISSDGVDGGASSGGVAPTGGGDGGDKGALSEDGIAGQAPGGGGGAYGIRASTNTVSAQGSASVTMIVTDASQFIAGMTITINGANTTSISSINYELNQFTLGNPRTWANNAAIVQSVGAGGAGAGSKLILNWMEIQDRFAVPLLVTEITTDEDDNPVLRYLIQFSRPVTMTLNANASAWVVNPNDNSKTYVGNTYISQSEDSVLIDFIISNDLSNSSRIISYIGNDSLLDDLDRHVPAFSNISYE